MDPDQIIWKATYPPYLQTIFSSFRIFTFQILTIFFSFSLTWHPIWAQTFQKATPPTIFIRSQPTFIINKVVTGGIKSYKCFGDLKKQYGTLKFLLTQDRMGWKFQNTSPPVLTDLSQTL